MLSLYLRRKRQRKLEDFKIEPTEGNSSAIPSIMTQPCNLTKCFPTFAPVWNELLLFEEPYRKFVKNSNQLGYRDAETIIFFELMDFLPFGEKENSFFEGGYHGNMNPVSIFFFFLKLAL